MPRRLSRTLLVAAALVLAPFGARATDLVVWWEGGVFPKEDETVREIATAFERKTGRKVDLSIQPQENLLPATLAAVEDGNPPDFVFDIVVAHHIDQWAHEGRLADLADTLGPLTAQFDRDALDHATLLDATAGRRGLYALPMAHSQYHVHIWRSLLERAGLTLQDIPKEWEPFWAFWCDKVQPAVRKATGRDDIWGVGLDMAADAGNDTDSQFWQFVSAYEADYVTRDGRLVIDEPAVRTGLVRALTSYTDIFRKGCTPPASADWDDRGNNQAFLAQAVVMTVNNSLSIPNALKATRPEDYARNAVTLGWPAGADGQPLAIYAGSINAVVFRNGGHLAAATEFVRFLVGEGWLAHWLDFSADRWLPAMPALLAAPFWLDPGDPHRMAAAMQFLAQPRDYWEAYPAFSGEWRHDNVFRDRVWPTAVHRVVAEGFSPEQAVDEAIARVHQILSE